MTYGFGYLKWANLEINHKSPAERAKLQSYQVYCVPLIKGPTSMKTDGPDWNVTTHVWAI